MLAKMNDGRIKDVPITEITKENYIVPERAKHVYHCIIEVRKFNAETGERLSRPRIQKFGKKAFESTIAESLRKQGYTITILHNPTEYLAQVKATQAKALAEQQAKHDAEVADAHKQEIAEAVAKALAEQQAKHDAEVAEQQAKHDAEVSELRKEIANAQTKKVGRPSKTEKASEEGEKTPQESETKD